MRPAVEALMMAARHNTLSALVVAVVAHNKAFLVVEVLEEGLIAQFLNQISVREEVSNNLELL